MNDLETVKPVCPAERRADLDADQLRAVEAPLNNAIVWGGAGSGKTRVLVYRILAMIHGGVPPEEIQVLTFSKAASVEIQKRLQELVPEYVKHITVHNYHQLAEMVLSQLGSFVNLENLKRIEDKEIRAHLSQYLKDRGVKKTKDSQKVLDGKAVLEMYEDALRARMPMSQLAKEERKTLSANETDLALLAIRAELERMQEAGEVSYTTMLCYFLDLLRRPELLPFMPSYGSCILVDEFQDVNWMEYEILMRLNRENRLFAVGDKNQCIYQFRGADDKYFEEFCKVCQNQKYVLHRNYRSTPAIVALTQSVVDSAPGVPMAGALSGRAQEGPGQRPEIRTDFYGQQALNQQIEALVRDVKMRFGGNPITGEPARYDEVAVLVRTGTYRKKIIEAFVREGIPVEPIQKKELTETYLKYLADLLRFLTNPGDREAADTALQVFGLRDEDSRKETLEWLRSYLSDCEFQISRCVARIQKDVEQFTADQKIAARMLIAMDRSYQSVGDKISQLCEEGFDEYMEHENDRLARFKEERDSLIQMAKDYSSIDLFLRWYLSEDLSPLYTKGVQVRTLHSAKGLEWPAVYIANVSAGILPFSKKELDGNPEAKKSHVRAEKHLLYVGLTRARDFLAVYGSSGSKRSPFIKDLEDGILKASGQ